MLPSDEERLVDFIMENKGDNAFIGMDRERVAKSLRLASFFSNLLVSEKNGRIQGVLVWSVKKWVPMRVEVENIVALGCAGRLLRELRSQLPEQFSIYALRNGASRKQEYHNPERVIRLFEARDKVKE